MFSFRLSLCLIVYFVFGVYAVQIFNNDLSSTSGWTQSGSGGTGTNACGISDQDCIYIQDSRSLSRPISTLGYHSIAIEIGVTQYAYDGSYENDRCYIEYGVGSDTESIDLYQDDLPVNSILRHVAAKYDDASDFHVKLGTDGNYGGDYCLFANLVISGTEITPSPTRATPRPTTHAPSVTTGSPTQVPTSAPSRLPTESPTQPPTTTQPSVAPTKAPTNVPTDSPTKSPTKQPTETPTKAPSKTPTKTPTEIPTSVPSEATDNPTQVPTAGPTATLGEGQVGEDGQNDQNVDGDGDGDDQGEDDSLADNNSAASNIGGLFLSLSLSEVIIIAASAICLIALVMLGCIKVRRSKKKQKNARQKNAANMAHVANQFGGGGKGNGGGVFQHDQLRSTTFASQARPVSLAALPDAVSGPASYSHGNAAMFRNVATVDSFSNQSNHVGRSHSGVFPNAHGANDPAPMANTWSAYGGNAMEVPPPPSAVNPNLAHANMGGDGDEDDDEDMSVLQDLSMPMETPNGITQGAGGLIGGGGGRGDAGDLNYLEEVSLQLADDDDDDSDQDVIQGINKITVTKR